MSAPASALTDDALASLDRIIRPATGDLRHPFVESSASYANQLWDWDSYFTLLALTRLGVPDVPVRACVENFLDAQGEDGHVPYRLLTDSTAVRHPPHLSPRSGPGTRGPDALYNPAKPILAQMALLDEALGTGEWLAATAPKLDRYLEHWSATQFTDWGLYAWRTHKGDGPDNHPALYGRPPNSVLGADLNSYFVREFRAMEQIWRMLDQPDRATSYAARADALAERINAVLWDPVDEFYYHHDALGQTPPTATLPVTWTVPLKFRTWTSLMPLWAGVATADLAERAVEAAAEDGGLICDYGIRTVTSRDPIYNTRVSGNPSNWQGPVWIVANYVVFEGLLSYGYRRLARRVADGSAALLHEDLRRNGHWHEYYDAETGRAESNPGFIGWNLTALIMHAMLDERAD
ncbi:MGH1-like glycoside hydrolase domain-containing protein [Ruania alba]|uniref:Putative isomerase n=1 Tax=Ruania alba TaxID=648782 RepID=A0A1H5HKF9_9MICO|nr:trehalase family glycosidase [Ruania alba]SEE28482.1 putative isomerase [Ruania alba]